MNEFNIQKSKKKLSKKIITLYNLLVLCITACTSADVLVPDINKLLMITYWVNNFWRKCSFHLLVPTNISTTYHPVHTDWPQCHCYTQTIFLESLCLVLVEFFVPLCFLDFDFWHGCHVFIFKMQHYILIAL